MSSLVTAMPVINKRLIAHNPRGPDERDGDSGVVILIHKISKLKLDSKNVIDHNFATPTSPALPLLAMPFFALSPDPVNCQVLHT